MGASGRDSARLPFTEEATTPATPAATSACSNPGTPTPPRLLLKSTDLPNRRRTDDPANAETHARCRFECTDQMWHIEDEMRALGGASLKNRLWACIPCANVYWALARSVPKQATDGRERWHKMQMAHPKAFRALIVNARVPVHIGEPGLNSIQQANRTSIRAARQDMVASTMFVDSQMAYQEVSDITKVNWISSKAFAERIRATDPTATQENCDTQFQKALRKPTITEVNSPKSQNTLGRRLS